MGWVVLFVFVMLLIIFLRNAPVVGSLIFKPLFDLIWIVVALAILGVGLVVIYILTPAEYIPQPVHNAVENLKVVLGIVSSEETFSIERKGFYPTVERDVVSLESTTPERSESKFIEVEDEVVEKSSEPVDMPAEEWDWVWQGVPPDDAPPNSLHLSNLFSDHDAGGTYPQLTSNSSPSLKVKVINVASDDTLTVRSGPHHKIPPPGDTIIEPLPYDADNVSITGCWNLGTRDFVSLNDWEVSVRSDQRLKDTWCFISDFKSYHTGWVNSWYLDLDENPEGAVSEAKRQKTITSKKSEAEKSSQLVSDLTVEQIFNSWILDNYRPRLEAFQQMVFSAPETALTINSMGLDNFTFGFMLAEVKLIQQNPDWTLQDIEIELANQNASYKNFYQIDMVIDKKLVAFIYQNKMTMEDIKPKAEAIVSFYNNCLQDNSEQRPSVQLSDREAQKECHQKSIGQS